MTSGVDTTSVATTRPETMLGDTAVAVHPEDARYTEYVGKKAVTPLFHVPVPILADIEKKHSWKQASELVIDALAPLGAAGEILGHTRFQGRDGGRIEDHQIRRHALAH